MKLNQDSAMSIIAIAILAASCFLLSVEAAPLSLHDQLQVALQKVAELKGNGTFQSCCNVCKFSLVIFSNSLLILSL